MRALLSYNCPNNVGQLKSDIQLICAKSYSLYLTNKKYKNKLENLKSQGISNIDIEEILEKILPITTQFLLMPLLMR